MSNGIPRLRKFIKWWLGSFLFLTVMIALSLITDGTENIHWVDGTIAILIGSVLLAVLFYYLEEKFIPIRQKNLLNKVIDLFGAYPIDDTTGHFKIGNFDVYVKIRFHLFVSDHSGYHEKISFHVPRTQIDSRVNKPKFSYEKDFVNDVETYRIYETNGMGLKPARKKLEDRLGF
jgi:hypothetical protein